MAGGAHLPAADFELGEIFLVPEVPLIGSHDFTILTKYY